MQRVEDADTDSLSNGSVAGVSSGGSTTFTSPPQSTVVTESSSSGNAVIGMSLLLGPNFDEYSYVQSEFHRAKVQRVINTIMSDVGSIRNANEDDDQPYDEGGEMHLGEPNEGENGNGKHERALHGPTPEAQPQLSTAPQKGMGVSGGGVSILSEAGQGPTTLLSVYHGMYDK